MKKLTQTVTKITVPLVSACFILTSTWSVLAAPLVTTSTSEITSAINNVPQLPSDLIDPEFSVVKRAPTLDEDIYKYSNTVVFDVSNDSNYFNKTITVNPNLVKRLLTYWDTVRITLWSVNDQPIEPILMEWDEKKDISQTDLSNVLPNTQKIDKVLKTWSITKDNIPSTLSFTLNEVNNMLPDISFDKFGNPEFNNNSNFVINLEVLNNNKVEKTYPTFSSIQLFKDSPESRQSFIERYLYIKWFTDKEYTKINNINIRVQRVLTDLSTKYKTEYKSILEKVVTDVDQRITTLNSKIKSSLTGNTDQDLLKDSDTLRWYVLSNAALKTIKDLVLHELDTLDSFDVENDVFGNL